MTLEGIIDIYGSSIGKHLVSKRSESNISSTFKGIKTYKIELWDVDTHKIIEEVEDTSQLTSITKTGIIEVLEYQLIEKMFKHYASK